MRFCRKIVGLKDEFYNRYIIRQDLFRPVVKAFLANGSRYNLLNSAVIELFEYTKTVSGPLVGGGWGQVGVDMGVPVHAARIMKCAAKHVCMDMYTYYTYMCVCTVLFLACVSVG